jgi:hypothetical protein
MTPITLLLAAALCSFAAQPAAAPDASTAAVSAAAPKDAAGLLPHSLIVTYYGNPLSKKMGILGEIPVHEMLARLDSEAKAWQKAAPDLSVRPGLELVATVASDYSGDEKLYRTRMPNALIEKVIGWAHQRGWITILDIQVGRSTVRKEVERLLPYLRRPDVHLALDPEFQMKPGLKPGKRIGQSDAEDVNVAIIMLSQLVEREHLPPKLLLVHRFTDTMLQRCQKVRLDPRVQVAVVMDGFGTAYGKRKIYRREISREPVQFAGIKLFYKNDKPMLTPKEVLSLDPSPRVVIYQ